MLKRFVEWLDDILAGEGSWAIVKAAVGIMSFAVLLGAVLGNAAVKAGALVAALLVLLSLGLILLADRRRLVRKVESDRRIISRLAAIISDDRNPGYRVIDWDETIVVESDGDARRRITIRGEVSGEGLWLMHLIQGCGWPQPARYRRHVVVAARRLLVDGLPGTSLTTTSTWVANGKFVLLVHLPEALAEGSGINLVIESTWPGMCAPLMVDRVPDDFTMSFITPVEHARYRVVLPPGCEAYQEPIGFQGQERLSLDRAIREDGQSVFTFEGTGLPMRHAVGMRLELKG